MEEIRINDQTYEWMGSQPVILRRDLEELDQEREHIIRVKLA